MTGDNAATAAGRADRARADGDRAQGNGEPEPTGPARLAPLPGLIDLGGAAGESCGPDGYC